MVDKVNFVVKVNDASAAQVKSALKEANITVRAVVEIYRESEHEGESRETSDSDSGG